MSPIPGASSFYKVTVELVETAPSPAPGQYGYATYPVRTVFTQLVTPDDFNLPALVSVVNNLPSSITTTVPYDPVTALAKFKEQLADAGVAAINKTKPHVQD
jgi:hypothetical protein